MGRGRVAAALLLALATCLAALPARTAANKISINWKPNFNYSDWLQLHRPFYKGDWLGTSVVHVRASTLPACCHQFFLLLLFSSLGFSAPRSDKKKVSQI